MISGNQKKMLRVLNGEALVPLPIWMMRQAGRYLLEYREIRAMAGSFLDLVYNPTLATEVTLQPIRRYGFDAAIIFADILVIPHALGVDVRFEEGEGPKLSITQTLDDLKKLKCDAAVYAPVLNTVARTRTALTVEGFQDTALIGFAGAPWTVACYMVAGHGKDRSFATVRRTALENPAFFAALIDVVTTTTIDYLAAQIEAGAEIIQIFDSWADAAPDDLFSAYVIAPTQKIVSTLRARFPDVPVIGFPRGAHAHLSDYAKTGVQGIGLGTAADILKARAAVGPGIALQGNLDPDTLVAGGLALNDAVDRILAATRGTPHIFNLGHGVTPATPPQHVAQVVERVRAAR